MATQIGVSFRRAGKIYHFDAGDMEFTRGDLVVVDTVRGREMGRISTKPMPVEENDHALQLKKIVRPANDEDLNLYFENRLRSTEAFNVCEDKIREHKLPMKLIDVEYTLDGNKAIFYFSAEGRIDFRNLVRDLAAIFKKRIELHQIGVRDEAKMLGGLGPCGRAVCCSTFMTDFDPVSIKMAKEQNLSLNPERISGTCGRLMCCLRHEYAFYHEMLRELPDIGTQIDLPEGKATIIELCIPKRTVIVEMAANNARVEVPSDDLPKVERGGDRGRDRRPRPDKEEGRDPSQGGEPGRDQGRRDQPGRDQGRRDRPGRDQGRRDQPGRDQGRRERPQGERTDSAPPQGERTDSAPPAVERSDITPAQGELSAHEEAGKEERPAGDAVPGDPGAAQPGAAHEQAAAGE